MREVIGQLSAEPALPCFAGFFFRKMHDNSKRCVPRKFTRPADDVFFGIAIEVTFLEW